jgi:hypothetical protein
VGTLTDSSAGFGPHRSAEREKNRPVVRHPAYQEMASSGDYFRQKDRIAAFDYVGDQWQILNSH